MNFALPSSKPAGLAGGRSRPEAGNAPQDRSQAPQAAPEGSSSPDAELLAACAAFDRIEAQIGALDGGAEANTPAEEAYERAFDSLHAAQDEHVEVMLKAPCTTLTGTRALAVSLSSWKPELLKEGTARDTGDLLAGKLVRSLLAMPGEDQDADLIAAVGDFCRLHDQFAGSEVSAEQERLGQEIEDLGQRIAGMRATTLAGLAAKAVALGRDDPGHAFDHETPGSISCLMLESLLGDGAALAGTPAPNPDADLLALRPEYDRLKAAYDAFDADHDLDHDQDGGADFDAFCMRVVAMPPARTAEGRAFKARAVLAQQVYVDGRGGADDAIRALLHEIINAGPGAAQHFVV